MSVVQEHTVMRACTGDKDALAELLEAFGPEIEAGLKISPKWRGQLDAADVMQVTYMEGFTHIRDFDPARASSFPAWLTRIAENNLRDAIRSLEAGKNPPPHLKLDAYNADQSLALFDVLTSGGETPSRIAQKDEAQQRLARAIECLPADYARTIRLYDLEGLPVVEVAAQLGRSVGAVYMLRMRAHDRLRELLGKASQILESRA
jgi:RNA polymerase sigma-70 factor (ECF subfamily)